MATLNRPAPAGSILRRVVAGSAWMLTGWGSAGILTLLSSLIAARMLGAPSYGELTIVVNTLTFASTLAAMGLALTATKFVAERSRKDPGSAGRVIGLLYVSAAVSSGLAAAALYVIAPNLSSSMLVNLRLSEPLRIAAIGIPFTVTVLTQRAILMGLEEFRRAAMIVALAAGFLLLGTPVGIALAGIRGGILAYVISSVIAASVGHIVTSRTCARHGIRTVFAGAHQEWRMLYEFSVPAFLAGMSFVATNWIVNVLIARSARGYVELGLFNAANQLKTITMVLPDVVSSVGLPLIASQLAAPVRNGEPAVYSSLRAVQALLSLLVVPLCVSGIFLSDRIMLIYGADFRGSGTVLIGLLASAAIAAAGSAFGPAIQGAGKMWVGLRLNLFWGTTYLMGTAVFVNSYGAGSPAFASLAAYLGLTTWGYAYLTRIGLVTREVRNRVFITTGEILALTAFALLLGDRWRLAAAVPATLLAMFVGWRTYRDTFPRALPLLDGLPGKFRTTLLRFRPRRTAP